MAADLGGTAALAAGGTAIVVGASGMRLLRVVAAAAVPRVPAAATAAAPLPVATVAAAFSFPAASRRAAAADDAIGEGGRVQVEEAVVSCQLSVGRG